MLNYMYIMYLISLRQYMHVLRMCLSSVNRVRAVGRKWEF